MAYVASDGSIGQDPPFFRRISLFFLGLWNFVIYFFKTLFGENVTKGGPRYSRDYRGGSGGSGPGGGPGGPRGPRPAERRVGRMGRMSDVRTPMSGG